MNYRGRQVSGKVFVEELFSNSEAATGPQSSFYSTGRLVEVHGFKSIDWTNSSDFGKSFRIILSNPGNVMVSSVLQDRGISKPAAGREEVLQNKEYLDRLYAERTIKPFDISEDGATKARLVAGSKEFLHGYRNDSKNDVGLQNDFVLGEMQRIWCIIKVESDDGEVRYHKIGGIITGFGESVDYGGGNTSFNIECAGFYRLLELTRVHTKQYKGAFYKTQSELYAEKVLHHIMSLEAMAQQEGILAQIGPIGSILYAIWMANSIFSWYGRTARYSPKQIRSGIEAGDTVNTVFYQAPLWLLGQKIPAMPESVRPFLRDLREDSPWPKDFQKWLNDTKAIFSRSTSTDYLFPRSVLFENRRNDEKLSQELFEFGTGGMSTTDLLPRVYYDDLIDHLFNNEGGLQIFEKRFVSGVEMYSFSTMSASDIMTKIANSILANVREDDEGNIVLEIPRYWEAPPLQRTDPAHITIREYATNKRIMPDSCVTTDYDGPDYIMDGDSFVNYNSSVSEANIVTHVEVPAKYQYQEGTDEVINGLSLVGYSGNMDENSDRAKMIAATERRYGFREMTAPTLFSNGLALKNPNGQAVRLKACLDTYADAILDFRNYARKAGTLKPLFTPWLDCGRNILVMERGELWMITSKSGGYRIGETEGDATLTLSCASAHLVSERLGYPYLDAINIAEDDTYVQKVKAVIAAEEANATTLYTAPLGGTPPATDAWDDIIYAAATEFSLPPDLLKALIAHESKFNPNAVSGSGAKGLSQLTSIAIIDVKQSFPAMAAKNPDIPADNVMLGAGYLNLCLKDSFGNTFFGVLGYNRGRGLPVREAKKYGESIGKSLSAVVRSPGLSAKVLQSVPKDKYGNPPGDAYVKHVSRQFDLYSTPNRALWDAVWIPSLWFPQARRST